MRICEICGNKLESGQPYALITIRNIEEKDDHRFKDFRKMEVHVNCAVDAKEAINDIRDERFVPKG